MNDAPHITCLCPTHGRFGVLRNAIACFVLQDYPNKHLLILNDAPVPLYLGDLAVGHCITVVNLDRRCPNLGAKRQALLQAAGTPLVAHWDDDDLYLPWHLSMLAAELTNHPQARCIKPRNGWYAPGPPGRFDVRPEPHHNVFEGQMLFDRERALELGGYPARYSGQARALLKAFARVGELHTWNPPRERVSYIYRWHDGLIHISGGGNNEGSHKRFGRLNVDFGRGDPLIPTEDAIDWARERLAPLFSRMPIPVNL